MCGMANVAVFLGTCKVDEVSCRLADQLSTTLPVARRTLCPMRVATALHTKSWLLRSLCENRSSLFRQLTVCITSVFELSVGW